MVYQNLELQDELVIVKDTLVNAFNVLNAVNHKIRQQVLRILMQEPRLSVKALHKRLQLEQAICSQHLAVLRKVGLVVAIRKGQKVFYSLNQEKMQLLMAGTRALL